MNTSFKYISKIVLLIAFIIVGCGKDNSPKDMLRNNQIPVPVGNDSLYKSVILSSLLPHVDDEMKFNQRLKILLGDHYIDFDRDQLAQGTGDLEFLKGDEFKALVDAFVKNNQIDLNNPVSEEQIQDLCNKLCISINEYSDNKTDRGNNNKQSLVTYKPQNNVNPKFEINVFKDAPDIRELPSDQYKKITQMSDHYRCPKPDRYVQYLENLKNTTNPKHTSNINDINPGQDREEKYSDSESEGSLNHMVNSIATDILNDRRLSKELSIDQLNKNLNLHSPSPEILSLNKNISNPINTFQHNEGNEDQFHDNIVQEIQKDKRLSKELNINTINNLNKSLSNDNNLSIINEKQSTQVEDTKSRYNNFKIEVNKIYHNSNNNKTNNQNKNSKSIDLNTKQLNLNKFKTNKEKDLIYSLDRLLDMPDCFMKHLKNAYLKVMIKNLKKNKKPEILVRGTKISFDTKEVIKELEYLKQNLKSYPKGHMALNLIAEALNAAKSNDWNTVEKKLAGAKRKLEPIDVDLLRFYKHNAEKSLKDIKDKDIIMFFGRTGAGKSTTLQFLAGSKMKKIIDPSTNLPHIAFENVTNNKALDSVTCRPDKKSETRYINIVNVNIDSNKARLKNYKDKVILCDCPGLSDTNGPEVDISNSLSIIKMLKLVNSVKPVVLIPFEEFEGRSILFKAFIISFLHFVKDYEKFSEKFVYLITRAENKDLENDVKPNIQSILSNMNDEEGSDDNYKNFLEDLLDNIEEENHNIKIINPVKDNRYKVLKNICKKSPIESPDQNFRACISEESRSKIKDQIEIYSSLVKMYIEKKDYKNAGYIFDQWKYIAEILSDEDYILDRFKTLIQSIGKQSKSETQYIDKQINLISKTPQINESDLLVIKNSIAKIEIQEKFSDQYVKNNVKATDIAMNKIQELITKTLCEIDKKSILDQSIWQTIKKLKVILKSFPEFSKVLSQVDNIILSKVKQLATDWNTLLTKDKIPELLTQIALARRSPSIEIETYGVSKLSENVISIIVKKPTEIYLQIQNIIPVNYSDSTQEGVNIINRNNNCLPMTRNDLRNIIKGMSQLKGYINKLESHKSTDTKIEKVLQMYESAVREISKYVSDCCNYIVNKTYNQNKAPKNSSRSLKSYLMTISELRKIKSVALITDKFYYKIEQILQDDQDKYVDNIISQITKIKLKDDNFSYELFFENLERLKKLEELSSEDKNKEVWGRIYKFVKSHLKYIDNQIDDIELSEDKYLNIKPLYKIALHLNNLHDLSDYFEKSQDIFDKLHLKIYNKINRVYKIIDSSCDLSQNDNERKDKYLRTLNDVEDTKKRQNEISKKLSISQCKTLQELENKCKKKKEEILKQKKICEKVKNDPNFNKKLTQLNKQIDNLNLKNNKPKKKFSFKHRNDVGANNNDNNSVAFKLQLEKNKIIEDKKQEIQIHSDRLKNLQTQSKNLLRSYNEIKDLSQDLQKKIKSIKVILESEFKIKKKEIPEIFEHDQLRRKKINSLQKESNNRVKNSKYTFGNLKTKYFSDMKLFLEHSERIVNKIHVKNITPLTSIKDNLKEKINKYGNAYSRFLYNQVETNIESIKKRFDKNKNNNFMKENDISELDISVNNLSIAIARIKDSTDNIKYPNNKLAYHFNDDNKINLLDEINSIAIDLNRALVPMSLNNGGRNLSSFKNHLNFARCMERLDRWLTNTKSFSSIYNKYLEILYKHNNLDFNKINEHIESMNFAKVFSEIRNIQQMSQLDNQAKSLLSDVIDQLYYFLKAKFKDARRDITLLGEKNVKIEKVMNLEELLSKLSDAKRFFFEANKDDIFTLERQKKTCQKGADKQKNAE